PFGHRPTPCAVPASPPWRRGPDTGQQRASPAPDQQKNSDASSDCSLGLPYNENGCPERADRALGRCRAGGGLLGRKNPAGRVVFREVRQVGPVSPVQLLRHFEPRGSLNQLFSFAAQ